MVAPFDKLHDLPPPSEKLKLDSLREVVEDEFSEVHNRLAPMLWSLTFDICRENPSKARINAVLNSLLSATTGWLVSVTPPGNGPDSDHFKDIVSKFTSNYAAMLEDHEKVREEVSLLANTKGRQLMLEHQNEALAKAVRELVVVLTNGQA